MMGHPPRSPLFPYTPLFRSQREAAEAEQSRLQRRQVEDGFVDQEQLGIEIIDDDQSILDLTPLQAGLRSEEHTSELHSHLKLVFRPLLLKKKKNQFDSSEHN